MHYIDLQRTSGICENVYTGEIYQDADKLYRSAIDNATPDTANVSWYFNLGNDQQHIGTRIFRPISRLSTGNINQM